MASGESSSDDSSTDTTNALMDSATRSMTMKAALYGEGPMVISGEGVLIVTGGVIVAIDASVPEGAFDCDRNTFAITGGTLVGIGGAYSTPTAADSPQNVVNICSGAQGSTLGVKAADGTVAFAFTILQSFIYHHGAFLPGYRDRDPICGRTRVNMC